MSPHGLHAISASLVIALVLTVTGQSQPPARSATASENFDPPPQPNPIAEQFATTYGAEDSLPTTGSIDADGNVAIVNSPTDVTVSLDVSHGATIVDEEGTVFTVAPLLKSTGEVGLAGDHVVVYDTDPTDEVDADLATRATSDGGIESTQYVPTGVDRVLWTVTSDQDNAHLVALENGTVALVDPEGEVDEEIKLAATDLRVTQEAFMEASIENATASLVVADLADEAVEAAETVPASEDPLASQEVVDVPSTEEIVDEAGQIPLYLQENDDVAALEAEVAALMEGVDPADLSAEDLELLDFADASLQAAENAEEAVLLASDAAIEAALIEESNEMLAEDLDQLILDRVEAEMSAELDLADADAEIDRAATVIVMAQAEVGAEGRVLGVFAAPMSKTLTGESVATTVDVVDDTTVAINLPDIGVPVVVDPFFIPVVVFAVRMVAQSVVKQSVKAAAQYAARQAAMKAATQQAARMVARKAAEIAQQNTARAAARAYVQQQRITVLRAQAQVASRVAAQKAQQRNAADAARQIARSQKAKDLTSKAAKATRDKAAKLHQESAAQAARAKVTAEKAAHEVVRRAAKLAKPVVDAAIKGIQVGAKTVQQAALSVSNAVARTVSAAKSPAGREFIKKFLKDPTKELVENKLTEEAVNWFVENNGTDADDDLNKCYEAVISMRPFLGIRDNEIEVGVVLPNLRTPAGVLAGASTMNDVNECLEAVQLSAMRDAGSESEPVTPDDHGGSLPAAQDMSQAAINAYSAAQYEVIQRAVTFNSAPEGSPVGAEIVEIVAPDQARASSRAHVMIVVQNTGPALPLGSTLVSTLTPIPWLVGGSIEGSQTLLRLVDENGDNVWSHAESVAALMELDVPVVPSQVVTITFEVTNGGTAIPGTAGEVTLNVDGPEAPGAPTLTATSGRNSVVPMSWVPSVDDPAAPTTKYEVQRTDVATPRSVTTTTYSWPSLTNGTTYSFKVRACSVVGCGSWSATKSAKPYSIPGAVAKPSITSQHNSLKVDWSVPSSGGSAITRYEVSGDGSASTTSRTWTHTTGQSGAGRQYRVRACNVAGCGAWSAYTNSARPKVVALARGAAAPHGYQYDTKVYGPPGWTVTLECHGPTSGAWWTKKVTLDSTGYYRSTALCYSGYPGGHWVMVGSLKSNTVSW